MSGTFYPLSVSRSRGRRQEKVPDTFSRDAFTLTELVVSIGIMVLMFTMAGTVFKVTTDSTGQAQAIIKISGSIRLLEQTIREDFSQTPRQGAILLIQAQAINAYWTQDDKDANLLTVGQMDLSSIHQSDPEREDENGDMILPRADVLMTFTARPATSYLCPDVSAELQQVVYGHAELGELNANGNWLGGPPNDFGTSGAPPMPGTVFPGPAAERWHLARRSVVVVDGSSPLSDLLLGCSANETEPGLDSGVTGATPANIWDGGADIVCKNDPQDYTEFDYVKHVVQSATALHVDWFRRSRMDLTPPAMRANRLGHYFVPRCASFKVEWAIDLRKFTNIPFNTQMGQPDSPPQELVWFDPGRMDPTDDTKWEPFGELDELAARYGPPIAQQLAGAGNPNSVKAQLLGRFPDATGGGTPPMPAIGDAQLPAWYPNDPFFPAALRITVDLFGRAGSLKRPIRHVMVIPVGT